jgi:Lipocalin-like domain
MNRIISAVLTASALIFGVFLPREEAVAQTTAKELVGTWTLVSIMLEKDGKKVDFYGPNPQGQATYEANGRVSVIITRSDLPKFASNNREAGTPEENKAVVQGSIAYFGTYSVSETDKTITSHIEGSTFPNWNGLDQKRSFNISGDELDVTNPTSSTGTGSTTSVWKRNK